jgi:hypothetical protein
MGRYEEIFQRSIKDPGGFWGEAAKAIFSESVAPVS